MMVIFILIQLLKRKLIFQIWNSLKYYGLVILMKSIWQEEDLRYVFILRIVKV